MKNNGRKVWSINVYNRFYLTDYSDGETEIYHNNLGAKSKMKEGIKLKGMFETTDDPSTKRNLWGREIYPKCMYNTLKEISETYGNIPVYITENGHGQYEAPDKNGFVSWGNLYYPLEEDGKRTYYVKETEVIPGYSIDNEQMEMLGADNNSCIPVTVEAERISSSTAEVEYDKKMVEQDIQAQKENNEEFTLQDEFNTDEIEDLLGEDAEVI